MPPSQVQLTALEMDARRRDRVLDRQPWSRTFTTIWMIAAAEADRAGAADAPAAGRPSREHDRTAPSCSSAARPGRARRSRRREVVLAEHVVQVDAGARDDHARAASPSRPRARRRCPRASTTETCVVDGTPAALAGGLPSPLLRAARGGRDRCGRRRAAAARARRGGGRAAKLPPRARVASRITSARAASAAALPGGPGGPSRSSSAEREGDQDAARRRRRVRDELVAAEGRAHGPPADDAVGGEIALASGAPPRSRTARLMARASDRRVERARRPRLPAIVERSREVGHAERLAVAKRSVAARRSGGLRPRLRRAASRIACRNACCGSELDAVARELDRGRDELRPRQAAEDPVRPPRGRRPRPGTAQEARADPEELQGVARSNGTSTSTIGAASPRRDPAPEWRRRSRARGRSASDARCTSMKPPAPGPVSGLSATQETKPAATQASTALPPASRIRAPASAVRGWPAATAPLMR